MIPPETPRCYSNIGFGLLAMVFEAIAGVDFESYCQMRLFDPLGMTQSTWRLNDVPPNTHAGLYSLIPEDPKALVDVEFVAEQLSEAQGAKPGSLFRHRLYSLPIVTDGLLRTSVNELGRFLSLYSNDGVYSGKRIVEADTLQMMLSNTHFGRALCWQGGPSKDKDVVRWHHGGGDPGVSTLITFEPAHKLGILLFSNFAGPAPFLSEVYRKIRSTFI
jgi:CubicO group peptidase (beta-lactamase class C family)